MYQPSKEEKTGLGNPDIHHSEPVNTSTNITSVVAEVNENRTSIAEMECNAIYHNHFEPREGTSANDPTSSSQSNMTSKTDFDEGTTNNSFSRRFSRNRQDKNTSSNVENDSEILNISNSSKYSRVLPSVIAMQSNGTRVSYKGHRRNVSNMSGKPLITSDSYSSTSDISECCSDNEDGDANRPPRPTHPKSKAHLKSSTTADQRGGGGCSSHEVRRDSNILHVVHAKRRHGDTTSHIIRVEDENDTNEVSNNKYEEEEIPNEPLKTFVAAIFLFMAFVATTASLAFVHDRVPFHYEPLPDVILDNVKYQHWGLDASEILLMTLVWTTVLITVFHKHRFIVYRRIFLIGGLHYFYRAITMALTVLPVADKAYRDDICQPQSNQTSAFVMGQRVLKLISGMGLAINGKHVYCGDYIYSGHTMSLVMAYLIIKEYSPRRWILLHYAAMVIAIAGVVTLLIARGHYSIDVVVAYWITTRIWWIFHTVAKNANLKEVDGFGKNENNYLKNLWWWYIFRWFECNVPVIVPHRYSWPIPQKLLQCKPVQFICIKLRRGKEKATNLRSSHDSNLPSNQDKGPNDLSNVATIG
jgi:shingomyelin synthase